MNKYLRISLIVAGVGIIGYAIYWFFTKSKAANGGLSTIGGAEKPTTSDIISPNAGPGKAAIDKRRSDILASTAFLPLQEEVRASTDIFSGIPGSLPGWTDRLRVWVGEVPYNIGDAARAALTGIKNANRDGGESAMVLLRSKNNDLKKATGTAFVGASELADQTTFDKQLICQNNQNCGNNYSKMDQQTPQGARVVVDSMAAMATNWLHGAETFDHLVTNKAIQDLRDAGWRFLGYDH